MIAATLAGNSTSAGAGFALMSSGTVTLAGGANITLSQNGNAFTVIGGAGAAFSGGVSTGGNTAGTTGTVGNGLLFFGGTNISLSQSSAIGGATITILGEPIGSFSAGVSSGGNTAGTTGTVAEGILFVGGTNITLSQSSGVGGATVTFIGPAPGTTQSAQTGISGIAGSGASTVTAGTVQFANSNGLTFGLNGSTMTASHDGITSQSIQTQGSVLINGSSGAISFNAGNLMSLSTVASNLTFINLISSATDIQEVSSASAAGAMVSRFANEGHVHPGVGPAGVSNIGNTAGATGALMGRVIFAGGNNITLSVSSSNNNAQTITISAPNAQTGISGIAGSGASTVTNGTVQFQNSNNMTFGLNGSTITGSFSVTNTIPGIATGVTPVASINSTGTATRYSPDDHQHAGVFSIGISAGVGNTAGTTAVLPGRMIFAGGNNITLSQSTSAGNLMTLTISAQSQSVQTQNMFAATLSGNTSGALAGISSGTLTLAGGNNITLSQAGNAVTISQKNPLASRFFWGGDFNSSAQQANGSVSFQTLNLPYDISFSRIEIPLILSLASSGTANTGNIVFTSGAFIYSASTDNLVMVPIAGATGSTTYTWASNTSNFSQLTGPHLITFPIATTLSGGFYFVGLQLSTTNNSSVGTATTQLANTISMLLGSVYTASNFAILGGSTNATIGLNRGHGVATNTVTATNQTVAFSSITVTGASRFQANFPVLFRNV